MNAYDDDNGCALQDMTGDSFDTSMNRTGVWWGLVFVGVVVLVWGAL